MCIADNVEFRNYALSHVCLCVCVCVCVCLFVCGSALLQPARSVCVASQRFFISYCRGNGIRKKVADKFFVATRGAEIAALV